MEGGGVSAKAIGFGSLVVVVSAILSLYIYTAIVGTKNLSWQTIFFIIATILMSISISALVGFKAGRGFANKL